MKNLSLVFVAALAFTAFGCKKKGGDCETAISHSMELSKADMAKMPGMDEKVLAKLKSMGVQHCKDDKWSDEVIKCMTDAKSEMDSQACYGKLPHEQQEKMNKAMMEEMLKLAPPTPPAVETGSAAGSAAGSDMGSAAAGSAGAMEGSAPGSAK